MADDAQAPSTAAKGKKKMMLIIILGVGVLALGGGGFFAYTKFFAHQATPEDEAETGHQPVRTAGKEQAPGAMYSMEPFIVNLVDPKGKRYLKLKIQVEVDTEIIVEKLKKLDPRLRDAVIMLLTSLSFEDVMTPEGKIRIRDELLDRFNQAIKPDRVRNIYFTDFVVQ
ncbi:MAG: flagellar basal body-associated FliL family protein [Thermodesulfobacteriota bacterium]